MNSHLDTPWSARLFGGLSVEIADRVITRFRTRKSAVLLAYLFLADVGRG